MDPFKKTSIFDALELSSILHKGSAAVLPTDTLPALAACPEYSSQLWNIKQRPAHKPFILMASSPKELFEFVLPIALEDAESMASRYWPGALTMILPASGSVVDALHPGEDNIGMRVPSCEVTIELLGKSGPLATTSANLSGQPPSLNAADATNCFPDLPLLGPLPWPIASGQASTVIVWKSRGCWQVLRSGAVIIEAGQDK